MQAVTQLYPLSGYVPGAVGVGGGGIPQGYNCAFA